jgi:hypothetical protein
MSDERAIDAFVAGIRRRDLIEELGRSNPRTIADLMEIANCWADGEVVVQNGRGHLRRIATETTIKIGDDIATSQIMTVPVKWRLASEEIVEEIIGVIIKEATTSAMIIEMRQAPTDKIIDLGFQGHTTYHPKIF